MGDILVSQKYTKVFIMSKAENKKFTIEPQNTQVTNYLGLCQLSTRLEN